MSNLKRALSLRGKQDNSFKEQIYLKRNIFHHKSILVLKKAFDLLFNVTVF